MEVGIVVKSPPRRPERPNNSHWSISLFWYTKCTFRAVGFRPDKPMEVAVPLTIWFSSRVRFVSLLAALPLFVIFMACETSTPETTPTTPATEVSPGNATSATSQASAPTESPTAQPGGPETTPTTPATEVSSGNTTSTPTQAPAPTESPTTQPWDVPVATPSSASGSPWLYDVDYETITNIMITHQSQTIEYVLEADTVRWMISGDPSSPVAEEAWAGTPSLLSSLRFNERISDTIRNPAELGLDPPEYEVRISFEGGDPPQFHIGVLTPDGTNRYLRMEGDEALYTVNSLWAGSVARLFTNPPQARSRSPAQLRHRPWRPPLPLLRHRSTLLLATIYCFTNSTRTPSPISAWNSQKH